MLRYLADENLNNDIIRGLLRLEPTLNIVRVQDVGLASASDPTILAWAAQEGRILLTHDIATVTNFAFERIRADESMPGVFEIDPRAAIGGIINDLHLLAIASLENEWEGQIIFLPLK